MHRWRLYGDGDCIISVVSILFGQQADWLTVMFHVRFNTILVSMESEEQLIEQ